MDETVGQWRDSACLFVIIVLEKREQVITFLTSRVYKQFPSSVVVLVNVALVNF